MKIHVKQVGLLVLISAITAFGSVATYNHFFVRPADYYVQQGNGLQGQYADYSTSTGIAPTDFTQASSIVIPTTVHIKTKTSPHEINDGDDSNGFGSYFGNDPFGRFFGGGGRYYVPGKLASGSGVIVSSDGYIVTNNHVIDGADQIVVTLNDNKTYKAKVVGTDPNTDLAVLKINAHDLPHIVFGNSDQVQVGQWVLACGYPLNLQTTVTAGIISAKSRELGINDEGTNPIESYIQTDAAVNPGNSGGPLVNTEGKLVGINSAIASTTGAFSGYAYAVPSNLVKKVVGDILKYGKVQRAYLGIEIQRDQPSAMNISFSTANQPQGVEVKSVSPNGAAASAGLRSGDVIRSINHEQVMTESDLLGTLARYSPGDVVTVGYFRNGTMHDVKVTLKNRDGNTNIVRSSPLDALGGDFQDLPKQYASRWNIPGGVVVAGIGSGLIKDQTDMSEGFVITKVGNTPVRNIIDLKAALNKQGNNVLIQGFYPNYPGTYNYAINDLKQGVVN